MNFFPAQGGLDRLRQPWRKGQGFYGHMWDGELALVGQSVNHKYLLSIREYGLAWL